MSSKIYELFGFPLEDQGRTATEFRKNCICPFMGQTCDGGGNRYQSFLHLNRPGDNELIEFFNGKTTDIPAGVCSLLTSGQTWIVCPRRLFTLDKGGEYTEHEAFCLNLIWRYTRVERPFKAGIWTEVKIKYAECSDDDDESEKLFDYTFDYIVCSVSPRLLSEAAMQSGTTEKKLESGLVKNGFTIALRQGEKYVEEYPTGLPIIIEVMTSSTSGGNKAKGNTIQKALVNAILGKPHEAPGINYRQVWARMVSQLIVKSQIGAAWGGSTVWVLQDALTDYISNTTDLNLRKLVSQALKEVNLLSLKYADTGASGLHQLEVDNLFAGQIPLIQGDTDFNKLLQASKIPPKSTLEAKLLNKKPRTYVSVQ